MMENIEMEPLYKPRSLWPTVCSTFSSDLQWLVASSGVAGLTMTDHPVSV